MAQARYHTFLREKMTELSRERVVLDVGGGDRFTKWLEEFKDLFKDCDYKSFDYDARTGADVVGDIHAIPLPEGSVDAIICSSVLEHVRDPIRAMGELHRILRPGGTLFLYVPSIYPYHARKGSYPDYWRFFDDTLAFLFADFAEHEIVKVGGYFKALLFFFPMQHKLRFIIDPTADFLDWLFKNERRTTTSGYYVFARK